MQGYDWLRNRLEYFESGFRFTHKQDDEEDADAHLFEEEWAGRALDQERRTKQAVQDSKEIVLDRNLASFTGDHILHPIQRDGASLEGLKVRTYSAEGRSVLMSLDHLNRIRLPHRGREYDAASFRYAVTCIIGVPG